MKYKLIFYIIFVVSILALNPHGGKAMEITSKDFKHNQPIPSLHTCDGKDISPHLIWSGAPEGTKSFALSCIDPDAPMGDFIHWLIYNIPATATEIPQGGPCQEALKKYQTILGKRPMGVRVRPQEPTVTFL